MHLRQHILAQRQNENQMQKVNNRKKMKSIFSLCFVIVCHLCARFACELPEGDTEFLCAEIQLSRKIRWNSVMIIESRKN